MVRNPMRYWKDVIHLEKKCFKNKNFGFSIRTDGVSARVQFTKTCSTTDTGKDGFRKFGLKEYVPLNLEDRRVVGLDPGRKDMFSCNDGTKKKFHCSGSEWRVMSGVKNSKKKKTSGFHIMTI